MDEREWRECADPVPMLHWLNERDASARKFRLFSAACARRLWPFLSSDHARSVIGDAERFADGLLSESERREVEQAFRTTFPPRMTPDHPMPPAYLAEMVAFYTIWSNSVPDPRGLHLNIHGAECVSRWVTFTLVYHETEDWGAWPGTDHPTGKAEADAHCRLIRDIFGDPFRRVSLRRAWLKWNGGMVPKLAEGLYEDRAFDRLFILADALEEGGCTNADILGHLRRQGPHVRGCWVIDLILGKQ